ncbi:hypothetical protein Tcan_16327 [Toxocara canis]|uniref:Uncharacterized protein n=1 Tax=Toxocara canis TaxID=6265 RepID=A0A0B2VQE0_TOXCA|nr:hypothetical protein Tcan_16327 [Toxocara canis]
MKTSPRGLTVIHLVLLSSIFGSFGHGVYITTLYGQVLERLPIKNSSASSLAVDQSSARLLVSVMHAKGRSIHSFDIDSEFSKVEIIPCPKEPKIELSRTRWITVSPRGEVFIVSGDNNRSAIWMYNRSRKWSIGVLPRKSRSVSCPERVDRCPAQKESIGVLPRKSRSVSCPERVDRCPAQKESIGVLPRKSRSVSCPERVDRCPAQKESIGVLPRKSRSVSCPEKVGRCPAQKESIGVLPRKSRSGWKTLKDSRKTRYQYLCIAEDQAEYRAVVLLTCDAAQNRLLLFVVDQSGTLINEYDLTKTYRLNDHIGNPASALVDENGNLLVLDYASGRLWVLLSGVKGVRRLKEIIFPCPLGAQQALGLAVCNDWVYVTCFNRREVVSVRYLCDRVFFPAFSSGSRTAQTQAQRRAISLPRPTGSSTRI